MLPTVLPRLTTDSAVRVFPGVWKPLFSRLPSRDRAPSLPLLYLFFVFYIFSYLLSKTMGCFSGCLMFSASIQKLFCGIYSAFKCSFDEFVGEKVVSPSYSSAILRPPLWLIYVLHIYQILILWTVVLEKTLDSPLNSKEIKPVNPKENQSWIFIGRTDAEAETPILWPPDVKNWLFG